MKRILGYCEPLSVAPGETVRFMVSCEGVPSYRAGIVRLICADDTPEGPGYKEEPVATAVDGAYPGIRQAIRPGSCARIAPAPHLDGLASFTLQAFIWPTTPETGRQGILTRWSERQGMGFGLFVDESGACALLLGDGSGRVERLSTGCELLARRWYHVGASYDASSGTATVFQRPLQPCPGIADGGEVSATLAPGSFSHDDLPLVIAACGEGSGGTSAHFNGKIDRPRLARVALDAAAREALSGPVVPPDLGDAVVAAWDFARDMSSMRIVDMSASGLHGELVNFPARAMSGHNWVGETVCWREAPERYGAIHFHDDDVCDAGWDAAFALEVPATLRSGIYAARLVGDGVEEHVPFFVRPPRGTTTAPLALLIPTATYMAYANYLSWADHPLVETLFSALWVAEEDDLYLAEHRELGASTYDRHGDGSGICHASYLRPMLNIRPKRMFLWNLNADSHLTDWLEAIGQPYDVVTDEDLHREGAALLRPYRCVMTGTHPEYYSREMLDGLAAYTEGGGRLIYPGGNGFYWRIAFHPERAGVIEVRRCNGTRNWVAAPGEGYHAFDGAMGGTWREQGRAPNRLVGVGFTAEGFDASSPYRRRPGSFDPRAAFMFEGIGAEEEIGGFGSVGGGAAGLELDRADPALGTPPHALLLASSEGHSDNYLLVVEDIPLNSPGQGGTEDERVRADMVLFETGNGGAVFSTGSIAWAGALAHDGYNNNVARITGNVLRRFLADQPLP